ncbi:glycosyltransferase family 2 protein [Poseidonocella sedimentorum]|uniref:glycosyltransferase family 2 protein n=1 Tax=Poseidonocella sedimentorum TaxID=871652 RepID=UPI001FE9DFD9|nr:glycosyltransferase family 2 protein [Poseidonocella sedimentorum]
MIPTLNEARHIERCVRSLLTRPETGRDLRAVVVDGGSEDATRDIVMGLMAEFPALGWLDNPARLQSAGINLAVRRCARPQDEILIRCDAHSVYPEGYIGALIESMERSGASAVTVVMDAAGSNGFQRAAAWIAGTLLGNGGSAHRGSTVSRFVDHGHHAAMRLDAFRSVGGYDADFSHNEDAELDLRLTRAGHKIWLEAGLRITYIMRPDLAALARQYWRYGRGRARTLLKHRVRPRLRQIAPVLNALALVAALISALQVPQAALLLVAYGLLLLGASLVGMRRLRAPCGLWAGPAVAAMHMAWAGGFLRQILTGRAA